MQHSAPTVIVSEGLNNEKKKKKDEYLKPNVMLLKPNINSPDNLSSLQNSDSDSDFYYYALFTKYNINITEIT